jgi:hypothetical protein
VELIPYDVTILVFSAEHLCGAQLCAGRILSRVPATLKMNAPLDIGAGLGREVVLRERE